MAESKASTDAPKHGSLNVYVRVRPLTKPEIEAGEVEAESELTGTTLSLDGVSSGRKKSWTFNGFTNVLPPSVDNAETFTTALLPSLARTVNGGTTACFCFGHTGAGKTHTILGYRGELGLYHRAAMHICDQLAELSTETVKLVLSIKFAELYGKQAFDLLNGRAECFVRESNGKFQIRSETKKHEGGRVETRPLRAMYAASHEDVSAAVAKGLSWRAVGSSSTHDESSRSHAILELEIVSEKLQHCREAVIQADSELHPIGHERTRIMIQERSKLFRKNEAGSYEPVPGATVDQELLDHHDALFEKQSAVVQAAMDAEQAALAEHPSLGGKLVLADLAGSEYGTDADKRAVEQSAEARREARMINTSLLALKECIRGISSGAARVPYRNSRLTCVLRQYMQAKSTGTVMIANVALQESHVTKTVNTLRYAALVAEAGVTKSKPKHSRRNKRSLRSRMGAK